MIRIRTALWIAISLVFSTPLCLAISIQDYIQGALNTSHSAKAAIDRINENEVGLQAARAAYLPTGNLSYSVTQIDSQSVLSQSMTRMNAGPTLSLSWMVFDSGIRKHAIDLARLAVNNSELGFISAKQGVIIQSLMTYNMWDAQSNTEYVYESFVKSTRFILSAISTSGKFSSSSVELVRQKLSEFEQKKASYKISADTLAIQVEGQTGIKPVPYIELNEKERVELFNFYTDLTLNRPLPSVDESLAILHQNNLSIRAMRLGIDVLHSSQKIARSAVGPTASIFASTGQTSTFTSMSSGGLRSDLSSSSRGRTVGVTVNVPLDAKSYIALKKQPYQDSASAHDLADLVRKLETDIRSKHRQVTLLREEVEKNRSRLKTKYPSQIDINNDQDVANFLSFFTSFEAEFLTILLQNQKLFASTVDYIGTIYVLEDYFQMQPAKRNP